MHSGNGLLSVRSRTPLFDLRREIIYGACGAIGCVLLMLGVFSVFRVVPSIPMTIVSDTLCPSIPNSNIAAVVLSPPNQDHQQFIQKITSIAGFTIILNTQAHKQSIVYYCDSKVKEINLDSNLQLRSVSSVVNLALEHIPADFDFIWTVSPIVMFDADALGTLKSLIQQESPCLVYGLSIPGLHNFNEGTHDMEATNVPSVYFSIWNARLLKLTGMLPVIDFGNRVVRPPSPCDAGLDSLTTIAQLESMNAGSEHDMEDYAMLVELSGVSLLHKCSSENLELSDK